MEKISPRKQLEITLRSVARVKGKTFLRHFIERAYADNKVAIALAKKILPDLLHGEGFESKQSVLIWRVENPDGTKTDRILATPQAGKDMARPRQVQSPGGGPQVR